MSRSRRDISCPVVFSLYLHFASYISPSPAHAQETPLSPPQMQITNPCAELLQQPAVPANQPNVFASPSFLSPSLFPPPVAPPRVCDDGCVDVWHPQVLPQGLIYQSYMAGAKEPRLSCFWNYDEQWGAIWDVAIGGRVGIWRYGNDDLNWPQGWQVDLEAAVFPRLDPFAKSSPLISSDYRFGVPLTYGNGNWQFKLAYYHISSHVGDEYLLYVNPGFQRINYVRNGVALGVGYFLTPTFRLYGEYGYSTDTSGGAEPSEFQFGFDWAQACNTGGRGGAFLAMNTHLREEVDGNIVVQFGWMWRQYARGPNFRLGWQYFYGKSDQFEFFRQTESRMGGVISYDF